jgi:hypothetical protein
MTLAAFTGAAGVGKTFQLMVAQAQALIQAPLGQGQKVLALTFMHGSRRRLDDRLRGVPGLCGRYICMTIDRFAWELCTRWRSLRVALGMAALNEDQYEQTCDAAGQLLEREEVRSWIAASYPYVIVDEAQDLTPQRLRIAAALEQDVSMFIAADEFQCLSAALSPSPAMAWIEATCAPTVLDIQRRTNQPPLIAAALAARNGAAVVDAPPFRILAAPGRAPYHYAATCAANAVRWNGGKEIALLTPSKTGGFAAGVVTRMAAGPCAQSGPYEFFWEQLDEYVAAEYAANLNLPQDGNVADTLAALDAANTHPAVAMCKEAIVRAHRITGQMNFPAESVHLQLSNSFARFKRFARYDGVRLKAMTIHQAKNREFEGVIVLWPYQVTNDPEQSRRLLYNAITRAQRWCTVIVQNANMLQRPPFAPQGA